MTVLRKHSAGLHDESLISASCKDFRRTRCQTYVAYITHNNPRQPVSHEVVVSSSDDTGKSSRSATAPRNETSYAHQKQRQRRQSSSAGALENKREAQTHKRRQQRDTKGASKVRRREKKSPDSTTIQKDLTEHTGKAEADRTSKPPKSPPFCPKPVRCLCSTLSPMQLLQRPNTSLPCSATEEEFL